MVNSSLLHFVVVIVVRCVMTTMLCLFVLFFRQERPYAVVYALNDGLLLSTVAPPMGWNSWNAFGCNVTEHDIRNAVRALLTTTTTTSVGTNNNKTNNKSLVDLGYRYVNVDDCWMATERTNQRQLQADSTKFPSGMKGLGEYVHSNGLLYGLYSSAGSHTCQGLPASLGFENVDAQTFASWNVDFLKYDNCHNRGIPSIRRYPLMRDALNATGRPIVYSLCQWGTEESWKWAPSVATMWRSTGDIAPTFSSIRTNFWQNHKHALQTSQLGCWSDPDMLQVGNGQLTEEENKSHFALWTVVAKSPLLLGMNMTAMTPTVRSIIMNENLIKVNQDPYALPATCYVGCTNDDHLTWSVFATRVTGGDVVAIVINWQDDDKTLPLQRRHEDKTLYGYDIGIVAMPTEVVTMVDLWTDETIGTFDSETMMTSPLPIPTDIPPHGCVVYRFTTTTTTTTTKASTKDMKSQTTKRHKVSSLKATYDL